MRNLFLVENYRSLLTSMAFDWSLDGWREEGISKSDIENLEHALTSIYLDWLRNVSTKIPASGILTAKSVD